jgi:cytidylate kinase
MTKKSRGGRAGATTGRHAEADPTTRDPGTTARRLVIAIDGPAGAGKSTTARALADALGYSHIDSGAMYRLVGLAARARGVAVAEPAALAALVDGLDFELRRDPRGMRVLLDGRDVTDAIREPAISDLASRVAAVPEVRGRLVERQRALAAGGGVVMDGRDIGTVVFPNADCKFFLVASGEERTRRRQADLIAAGTPEAPETTRAELDARDRRDCERQDSPLRAAADAITIDTSALTPTEVLARMLERVRARAQDLDLPGTGR